LEIVKIYFIDYHNKKERFIKMFIKYKFQNTLACLRIIRQYQVG